MGANHSKPEDDLQYISKNAKSIRSSLRNSPQNLTKERKTSIVEQLARGSNHVAELHGRVKQKKIDAVLKEISEAMEEVLRIEPRELDGAAIETDSFVHVPINRQQNRKSIGTMSTKSSKKTANSKRSSAPNIRDIEASVSELKTQIKTAINNYDTKQLKLYERKLKIMATEMELLHVEADTPLKARKDLLSNKITTLYRKVVLALSSIQKQTTAQRDSQIDDKNKAMRQLSEIELQLAENESLLDKMIKDKNTSSCSTIRGNVVMINDKLTKVRVVDNEVKSKIVMLTQKVTETVKNLDALMSKREFDSKFTKSVETFERIMKNFNVHTNAEETKTSLNNLTESVRHIEEINESSKRKKKELHSNIATYLQAVEEQIRKEEDSKTIQQIVEDNVVLRNKIKSSDKEYTVIDQFINYWNNIRNNFDLNAYSKLSLLRIDSVLDEMQSSIYDIRLGIANKCDTKLPSRISNKFSQSVPKLSSNRGSIDSGMSQQDGKILKTKVKLLNASTPELANVGRSQDSPRFSKVEEVRRNVYYVKEKLEENKNRDALRSKLEDYLKSVRIYTHDPNKGVANNAVVVCNEITEILYKLSILEIKTNIEIVTKKIQAFGGSKYDREYDLLRHEIEKLKENLTSLAIPHQFSGLVQEKEQLNEEVLHSLQTLEERPAFYNRPEAEDVKKIKNNLQTLNDKVKRFSGTYKGVLYNNIERDLNKLLLTIGESDDRTFVEQTTKEIERLLQILEQRSSLAQSFKNLKIEYVTTHSKVDMTKIKSDLANIKNEIDRTPDDNINAFIGLQSRLDLVNLELSQVPAKSNEHLEKEKDILGNEALTLKNVVDAKVTLGQQPVTTWPDREPPINNASYPRNDINKEMEKFEKKFQVIKNEISVPNSEEDIHKYYKLAQDIKKLKEKLDTYKFIKNTDLYMRQMKITDEMQYYINALEKEAKEVDYVLSLEKKVDTLESNLRTHAQRDLKLMAEELQAIQSKLEKCNIASLYSSIRQRKTSVQQKTDDLAQKLKQIEIETEETKELGETTMKINEFEEKLQSIKCEIAGFVGVQSDKKFDELDETLMRMILVLEKIETNNDVLKQKKIDILRELHQFGQVLDERSQQTEEIVDLENLLEKVTVLINKKRPTSENLDTVNGYMEEIKGKLKTINVNSDLEERRKKCALQYTSLVNALSPANRDSSDTNITTTTTTTTSTKTDSSEGYTTKLYSIVVRKTSEGVQFANTSTKITDLTNSIQPPPLPMGGPPDLPSDPLKEMENKIDHLQTKFLLANDDDELEDIEDNLNKYTIELNNLVYPKESLEYKKRNVIFERIEKMSIDIDNKAGDDQKISRIETQLDELGAKMNGQVTPEKINELDEQFIQLQIALGKISNKLLKPRADACMMRLIFYLQAVKDFKKM